MEDDALIPDINTGNSICEKIRRLLKKIKNWMPTSKVMYFVFLPLMFVINYGFNQLPEWASMLSQCLFVAIIGLYFCQYGINHVLKYYISLAFFLHLSYKFNRFKKQSSLIGSLYNCSWIRNVSTPMNYCYEILDNTTPGLSVPWIGLIAETITDVLLGILKTFLVFLNNYDGKEIVKLLVALGGVSLITILFQYAFKIVKMFKVRQ